MNPSPGFITELTDFLEREPRTARMVQHRLQELGRPFLMRSDLQETFVAVSADPDSCKLAGTPLERVFSWAQEAALGEADLCVALRTSVARWSYLLIRAMPLQVQAISTVEYLKFKERLVDGSSQDDDWALELDLGPFSREFTKMQEARSIGQSNWSNESGTLGYALTAGTGELSEPVLTFAARLVERDIRDEERRRSGSGDIATEPPIAASVNEMWAARFNPGASATT